LHSDRSLVIDRYCSKISGSRTVSNADRPAVTLRNRRGALLVPASEQLLMAVENAAGRYEDATELIVQPQRAVDVESAIRNGYLDRE
jgi:hypothetical protein